jgi:hypothetical protein
VSRLAPLEDGAQVLNRYRERWLAVMLAMETEDEFTVAPAVVRPPVASDPAPIRIELPAAADEGGDSQFHGRRDASYSVDSLPLIRFMEPQAC